MTTEPLPDKLRDRAQMLIHEGDTARDQYGEAGAAFELARAEVARDLLSLASYRALEAENHDLRNRAAAAEWVIEILAEELALAKGASAAQVLAAALGRLRP